MTTTAERSRAGRLRLPWWIIVLGAIAALVGVIALIGGFNDVPVEEVPVTKMNVRHDGTEVSTTVNRVYLTSINPATNLEAEAGTQYLAVEATLENTTKRPNIWQRDTIRVLLDGAIEPTVTAESNVEFPSNRQISFLQAGLPTDVVYLWAIDSADAAAGDDIIIGIFDRFRITNDPIFDDTAYTSPIPVARIVTTIGEQQ